MFMHELYGKIASKSITPDDTVLELTDYSLTWYEKQGLYYIYLPC